MQILRAKDYHRMPWKNGGGETSEIIAFPAGADLNSFGWRVSMALVETDGPFSVFSGIDRTLSILRGDGFRLNLENEKPRLLDKDSEPFSFAADIPTSASLVSGAVTDLNVMTRRSHFSHQVKRLECHGFLKQKSDAEVVVLFCADGSLTINSAKFAEQLGQNDCLCLGKPDTKSFTLEGEGLTYFIEITASA